MPMPCVLLIVLLIAGAGPAGAAGEPRGMLLQTDRSEALLEEGRRHLYSFRLPAAERAFRALAAQPDGAPAAAFYLAQSTLWRGIWTGDEAALDVFYQRSDSLVRLLDRMPASAWRDYLAAEADLQRALAHVKTGRHVKAALAGRSAFIGFERLLKAHPDFEEAYKGMGLLHLSLGSLPGAYRSLLRILGYSGTIEGGMAELDRAAAQSRYNREEALAFAALARSILFRAEHESLDVLQRLHRAYPDSPLIAHLYGFVLLSNRRAAEAEQVFRVATRRADDPAYCAVDYADYYLADALFKLGRLDEAEAFFRRYLARHEGPALKAMTYLGLGEVLELQGRRDEALPFYRKIESRGFDTDEVARRRAAAYLAAPMTDRQRQLLLGRNAFDGGRYDEALAILAPIRDNPAVADEERAEAAYRMGRVYHVTARYDEAIRSYGQAVARPGPGGTGWAAWSQFYIGEIHALRGERARAEDAFRRARAYQGAFDYAQALEQSIKAALERLDDAG